MINIYLNFYQVDGVSVLEMSHSDVVSLIQGLPIDFRLVVARKRDSADGELPIAVESETEVESQPSDFQRQGDHYKLSTDKAKLIFIRSNVKGVQTGHEISASVLCLANGGH